MKLKKNDEIIVMTGKDKGKKGKIDRVIPRKNLVVINGINISKRHLKTRGQDKPGGIIDIAKPLAVSKVMLLCPQCKKPTRIGYEIKGSEKKRVCRKCNQYI